MTTTELIKLLKDNEFGGATGKVREVNIAIPGYAFLCDLDISIDSTDDGLYTAICLLVKPGTTYLEEGTQTKQITKEMEQLMIDFASTLLYMKNDDWHHKQELDEKYAKESISWFLKDRNITVKD